jgi:hypothetical protein
MAQINHGILMGAKGKLFDDIFMGTNNKDSKEDL